MERFSGIIGIFLILKRVFESSGYKETIFLQTASVDFYCKSHTLRIF
jgi:hypothetical protein